MCAYWPEFAQNGKEMITVRQLLSHHAALFAFDERVDRAVVADLDRPAAVMARQRPAWKPGTRQAYHACCGGLNQTAAASGNSFQDEIATPLRLEFYIRLPETIPNSRFATLVSPAMIERITGLPMRLTLASLNPRSNLYGPLVRNPGALPQ